jgi:predicted lipoprotein
MSVNPDDLRFEYWPASVPMGRHKGTIVARWESPDGPFSLAWLTKGGDADLYESEPELRREVAADVAAAYERARGLRSGDQEAA